MVVVEVQREGVREMRLSDNLNIRHVKRTDYHKLRGAFEKGKMKERRLQKLTVHIRSIVNETFSFNIKEYLYFFE